MQKGIYSVKKKDFIHIYSAVYQQALFLLNIQSGFKVPGLVPLLSESTLKDLKDTNTIFYLSQQSISSILRYRKNISQSILIGPAEEKDCLSSNRAI